MTQYNYSVDTGIASVDTSDLLSNVQGEFKSSIQQNLNVSSATLQGTMIAAETIARSGVMKNNVEQANLLNPNFTYGTHLDAVCSFLGVDRGEDDFTAGSNIDVIGNSGTTISAGSRAMTVNGDVFVLSVNVTIPAGGIVEGIFVAQSAGPVPLPIGPLTIIDGTIGWGGANVTASTVITLGTLALTDPQLKNARNVQLASLGRGSAASIIAQVSKVPNVTSVKVVENNTGAVGLVGGVTFTLPNAFWVCVAGTGNRAAIAAAILKGHGGGCPWDYGSAGNGVPVPAVSVQDPVSGQNFLVKSTTPILFDTYVNIIVSQGTSSASTAAIQQAVVDYANGLNAGEAGFVVGASVSAFELSGSIAESLPGLYIKSVQVACVPAGAAAPTTFTTEFVMTPFQQAQIAIGNVKVAFV